ncbi:MAG: FAD-dependent thymidylate synthase [Okeania sp. SIO3I5]|uniref:FAD-dependent thymidylate synthase n=1 Tax=Okeania sp. SIO3I5 TaxID=2607805 RepID=UPI0013BC7535|nr:FAD-dependent thymidylate synthase [Okeania sp. SIO3I5]NEQ40488.1 FAD-dependent thymidylate synthase [Okeania sp. SIO3I5]
MDKFRVEVITKTPNPQQVIYAALHQDYSEGFVFDEQNTWPSEAKCGEIIVKRLLAGDRGHYGCYSADTEVLTNQGWMTWNEVTYSTQLLTVNTDTKEAWFEKPNQLYEYDIDDELYYVQSNFIDLLVTKDHRMIISQRTSTENNWTEWFSKKAEDVYNTSVRYLLNCYLKNNARKLPNDLPENIDLQTAFRIAGFFYRDGLRSINKNSGVVRFRIKNSRKIDYLLSLNLEIKETEGNRFVIEHKSLASWIHRNFSNCEDKTVPIWLLELPANLIASFWDGLQNSDHTNIKEKSWYCNSTNKNALEIIQATAHINGFRANLTLNNKNEGEADKNHKPCWRLDISEISTYPVECCQENRSVEIKEGFVNYKGKVYCASVSTGALLVRRNGKVIVCGNCIEHPQITFNCGFFPHSVMQQARTHRIGCCLSGNTMVRFGHSSLSKGEKYYEETIEKLANLWHYGRKHQQTSQDAKYMQESISRRTILTLDTKTNQLVSSKITNIYINGEKETYTIKTVSGKEIRATLEHQFWTNQGWKRLKEFNSRTQLCEVQLTGIEEGVRSQESGFRRENCMGILTPNNFEHGVDGGVLNPQKKDKIAPQEINFMEKEVLDEKGNLRLNRNSRPLAEVLIKSVQDIESTILSPLFPIPYSLFPNFVEIESIEKFGQEITYDIEVEHPEHNFIANGLVVHNSFDVQSYRYCSGKVIAVADGKTDIETAFYLRPVGEYSDRQGKKYYYSAEQREKDLEWCLEAAKKYQIDLELGMSEEHARGKIPFDYRQHFVVSFNCRSLLHFLDLRYKKNAQLEIQKLCELMWPHVQDWVPNIAEWYEKNRLGKSRLAP